MLVTGHEYFGCWPSYFSRFLFVIFIMNKLVFWFCIPVCGSQSPLWEMKPQFIYLFICLALKNNKKICNRVGKGFRSFHVVARDGRRKGWKLHWERFLVQSAKDLCNSDRKLKMKWGFRKKLPHHLRSPYGNRKLNNLIYLCPQERTQAYQILLITITVIQKQP